MQPKMLEIFIAIVTLFPASLSASGLDCSCDPYQGRIWDTQRCCVHHGFGQTSSDVKQNGQHGFNHKCQATPAWKTEWARTPVSAKWGYLSHEKYLSIRDDPDALARVPAPDKVQCYLRCVKNEDIPGEHSSDYGEDKSLFQGKSYFMEHHRHILGSVGYCYKVPTAEEFARQKAKTWDKVTRHDPRNGPHVRYRAHEQTPTLPNTGFVEAEPSRFHCVEAAWSDFA